MTKENSYEKRIKELITKYERKDQIENIYKHFTDEKRKDLYTIKN